MHGRAKLAAITGVVLLILSAGLFTPPQAKVAPAPSGISDEAAKRLQIDLNTTEGDRLVFKEEYAKRVGFDRRDMYEGWIDRIGVNGIVLALKETDPRCHDEGHDLGKVIYSRLHDIGDSLAACDGACNSGCMHGVLMEAFAPGNADPDHHVSVDEILAQAETSCAEDGTYSVGDCIHGIGHAFMFLSDYDIPKAMSLCDQLKPYAKAYYCATGAYMEYIGRAPGAPFADKSLFYPCDTSPYPSACFRYKLAQNINAYYRGGGTYAKLIEACRALPRNAELGCMHGVGNSHGAFLVSGKATLDQICQGNHDQKYVCIEGMMERMARYYPDEAKKTCDAEPAGWTKDLCEEDVRHGLYDLDKPFDLYPQ